MHFSMIAASIAATAGLAAAAPLVEARQGRPPANFYLQSKVKSQSPKDLGSNKQDLWLGSYHTGAGLGAATFSPNKSSGAVASLNATGDIYQTAFQIGEYKWPMAVEYGPYQTMESVTISVAGDQDNFGFYFNDNGLQWNYTEFTGWAACDFWYSGSPSLFATVSTNKNADLPVSCSEIELVAVAA
jgi:hypothetical protein